jgi:hypothetical protein
MSLGAGDVYPGGRRAVGVRHEVAVNGLRVRFLPHELFGPWKCTTCREPGSSPHTTTEPESCPLRWRRSPTPRGPPVIDGSISSSATVCESAVPSSARSAPKAREVEAPTRTPTATSMTPDRIALPVPCLKTDTRKTANQIPVRFPGGIRKEAPARDNSTMQRRNSDLAFSPSDLNDFLECEHLAALGLAVSRGELARPEVDDPQAALIRRKGEEHERAYLAQLRAQGKTVLVVDTDDHDWERAARVSADAIRSGSHDVVYQGMFVDADGWRGGR